MVLLKKRLEERRNAFLFCIQYEEDKIPRSSTKNYDKGLIQMFFDKILSKYLLTKTSKVKAKANVLQFRYSYECDNIYARL